MHIPPDHTAPTAESLGHLVRRIANRDEAAFGRLYRRLVRPVFAQVRESLGGPADAVPVTRAVFVDVWRLAPVFDASHDDVLGWVTGIAARRAGDRLRELGHQSPPVGGDCHGHLGRELVAALDAVPRTGAERGTTPPTRPVLTAELDGEGQH